MIFEDVENILTVILSCPLFRYQTSLDLLNCFLGILIHLSVCKVQTLCQIQLETREALRTKMAVISAFGELLV